MNKLAKLASIVTTVCACGSGATPPPAAPQNAPAVDIAKTTASADTHNAGPAPIAAKPAAPPSASGERPTAIPGSSIRFTGGDGSSRASAIVIEGAKGETDGTEAEYWYLEKVWGPRGQRWTLQQQSLLGDQGRHFDALEIVRDGKTETIYFDISAHFGKLF